MVPFLAGQEVVFWPKASRPSLVSIQLPIRTALEGDHHHHLVPGWGRSLTVPYAVMAYTRTPLLFMVRSHGKIAVIQIKGGMGGSEFTALHSSLYLYIGEGRHT